ncbi:hypothetical protein OLQ22_08785 [Campylobacter jejuni]|nr:hypothetical protein [Campylobacter jejuni]
MKKIIAGLICILFLGGCSSKTAGMAALGVIHSPQIVALGAFCCGYFSTLAFGKNRRKQP